MNLSYWEKKTWFSNIDYCIIGSGIVGLSCALHLRKLYPKSKIVIIERGVLPSGASTKNAGFACFGSISEILSDLQSHSEEEIFQLVHQRALGLDLLKSNLTEQQLGYINNGGYEVFLEEDRELLEDCLNNLHTINAFLEPIFNRKVFSLKKNFYKFHRVLDTLIYNPLEAQIDVGLMMNNLSKKATSEGIMIINNLDVKAVKSSNSYVDIILEDNSFTSKEVFVATNAFSRQLINVDLRPARNQVVITEPIADLNIKGVFHLHKGYYYFRNIDNRILLGGGRHLDVNKESTTDFGTTDYIQKSLEDILRNVIFQGKSIEIDQRWSGILGIGPQKKPICKTLENRIHCGVRLGGMGIAIGSNLGKQLAELNIQSIN